LIDIGDEPLAGGYNVCLTRIGMVVGEVGVEVIPICAIFEIGWWRIGNNFVRSADRAL
jgi:hypothetical protein